MDMDPVATFSVGTPAPIDEDLAPVQERSDLDLLRQDLAQHRVPDITLPVPGRDGYACRYRVDITGAQINELRRRCKSRKHEDGVDGIKFAALLLAHAHTGLIRQGRELYGSDGEPLTFRHPELLELLGVASASEAVRRLYGLDGQVDAACRAVLREAGWGEDLAPVDPTAAG
ncbi:hypothetical protein LI90_4370 (plasmid) [Carbonactinospora thermoautotrophica]|uniref:Uncharacterized protein n=1 Tax=Carbonactinospora thermoautotrophica TaxID=1469144 RepID=A0A132MHU0_9ACTN|nr:hypothetical protein [Carbonactinospora thermoautotrophica]KWW97398.1 hypothetical protein LI90_4370 [Carbonactinospora thermoautotrophica]